MIAYFLFSSFLYLWGLFLTFILYYGLLKTKKKRKRKKTQTDFIQILISSKESWTILLSITTLFWNSSNLQQVSNDTRQETTSRTSSHQFELPLADTVAKEDNSRRRLSVPRSVSVKNVEDHLLQGQNHLLDLLLLLLLKHSRKKHRTLGQQKTGEEKPSFGVQKGKRCQTSRPEIAATKFGSRRNSN